MSPAQAGWTHPGLGLSLTAIQAADPPPAGKRWGSRTAELIVGVPKWVYSLEDIVVQTPDEIIDAHFPQTGVARVLFEAIFELANRVRVLEGDGTINRAQLKNWLKDKLP